MSARGQRWWSGALLAVLALSVAGALSAALAACSDCCHEMPARGAAPCQSAVSIQCCDGALGPPATTPTTQEPVRALPWVLAPVPVAEPTLRSARLVALPPLRTSPIRSVVLRL